MSLPVQYTTFISERSRIAVFDMRRARFIWFLFSPAIFFSG